ncbi:MAG: hypothetical protein ACE5EH_02530 [Gammaproteobacteria bacterium]
MPTTDQRPVFIENSDSVKTSGVLNFTVYDSHEKMSRAIKLLALLWGLAIVTLFIPIAHFFLVPGFLIAGPIMAYSRYKVNETKENVYGECPTCREQVTISLDPADKLPLWTYCSANNDPVQVLEDRS